MTLTIDLTPEQEARLNGADAQTVLGSLLDSTEAARRLQRAAWQALTPAQRAHKARELFAQFAADDAKRTPEERAEEDAKWAEIDRDLNEGLAFHDVDVTGCE